MGNKRSQPVAERPLPPPALQLASDIFDAMDTDHSGSVDWQETFHFWQKFAKINTQAMFDAVDSDHNGEISRDEWVGFWTTVYNTGMGDAEIMEELLSIRDKSSWVSYRGAPKSQVRKKE